MEQNNLLVIGAVSILTIFALYLLTRAGDREGRLDRDDLVKFLDVLARRWFVACRDVAELSRSIRQKLVAQGVNLTEEQFKDQLLNHCGVLKKLEEIQGEVLRDESKDGEDVEEAQTEYADDPMVKGYSDGFRAMLEDCVHGENPIMPNFKIPEEMTEQKILEIWEHMQQVEIRKVHEHFERAGGFLTNVQVLGQVLKIPRQKY